MKRVVVIGLIVVLVSVLVSLFFVNANNSRFSRLGEEMVSPKDNILGDYVEVFIKTKDISDKKNMGALRGIIGTGRESAILKVDKEKIKYNSKSGFFANISLQEFEDLRNDLGAENVVVSLDRHIVLQDSVPLILANSTHVLQGEELNLTGVGQTVCVIDTGVNYSHADLGGCYGNNDPSSSCKIIGGWDFYNSDSDPVDDNGHGTHVAGTIAANGSITGVAPGAKIVMIKACDSSGQSCPDLAIARGIDWCVDNASIFNISVISMSLGGDVDEGYCNGDSLASFINNAVTENISVVIASGNDGYYNAISSPACVASAIPVSATNKNDTISYYANTNSLVMLLAPGGDNSAVAANNINSTWYNGGYEQISGTSMATPHVSGAIAILNQYLDLTSREKTPAQIELILNNTGVRVQDVGYSELNFSRIDIYSAIISLDEDDPNVTLISPSNNSVNQSTNISFSCNATDLQLSNMTFYLWNSSGEVVNQTSFNISGASNQISISVINLTRGSYKWNCLAGDVNGNIAFAANNFTLVTNNISTSLLSPVDNFYTNVNDTNFTCVSNTRSDVSLSNVTLYLWNSSSELVHNETKDISGVTNISTFNYSFIYEDNYVWNCLSVNNESESVFAENNYSLTYDITSPNIIINLPGDLTSYSSNSQSISFEYNVSDNFEIGNCSLIINDVINLTNSSVTNLSVYQYFAQEFSPGSYSWSVNCTDMAGNVANSSIRSFIVSAPAVSRSSGGGGGGGGGVSTVFISTEKLNEGVTQNVGSGGRINMNIGGINHSLYVNKIVDNSVNITLRSDPINFILAIGEDKKINVSSVDYYGLYIKLNNVSKGKANLTIKAINEKIHVDNFENLTGERHILDSGIVNNNEGIYQRDGQYLEIVVIIGSVFMLMIVFVILRMIHLWRHDDKKKKRR